MTITKSILSQYSDLKEEIKENKERIAKIEKQISRMEDEGTVRDVVSGGEGGIQHFCIEGIPLPKYKRQKTLLLMRKIRLAGLETAINEKINQIEEFIVSIDDSRMRRIISLRFVDNLSWNQVADKIGGGNTEDSIRMAFTRFMENKSCSVSSEKL